MEEKNNIDAKQLSEILNKIIRISPELITHSICFPAFRRAVPVIKRMRKFQPVVDVINSVDKIELLDYLTRYSTFIDSLTDDKLRQIACRFNSLYKDRINNK